MNNLIVSEISQEVKECGSIDNFEKTDVTGTTSKDIDTINAMQVALESAKMFNALIDEMGLSSEFKLSIARELFNKAGVNIPDEISKKRKRKYTRYSVEMSKHIDTVHEMLLNKARYEDISEFLKSKGENISKSSVARYAQEFFKTMERNNPPTNGGAL